ncbi:MAG: PHB depolymerase family esterase [Acidimicrobiales bacterium]
MTDSTRDGRRSTHRRTYRTAVGTLLLWGLVAAGCASDDPSSRAGATRASTTTVGAAMDAMLAARPVTVKVPPTYDPATPAPLLVLLHGYGVTGEVQNAYLKLTPVMNAHGMLEVYPDGTLNERGKRYWNATPACCAPPRSTVDDSAYISAIIARARADYNVDPKRIFVMGHSNGGFMAYRMACDHADVVAAIVSIEGAIDADPSACSPSAPVSVLAIHGTGDDTIGYDGGRTDLSSTRYPSAPEAVRTWAKLDGCSTTPDSPAPPDRTLQPDRPPATVTSYSTGCRPGGHAELWTQPDGVHIPPWVDSFPEQVIGFLLAHPKP